MAADTEHPRLNLSHDPGVGLMAIETLHLLFHMEVVLPHLCFVTMALPEAVLGLELNLPVGLVTLVALEV